MFIALSTNLYDRLDILIKATDRIIHNTCCLYSYRACSYATVDMLVLAHDTESDKTQRQLQLFYVTLFVVLAK